LALCRHSRYTAGIRFEASFCNSIPMRSPYHDAPNRMLAATLVAALALAAGGCREAESFHGVAIVGSEEFTDQIRAALALIREKSPDDFALISKHVRRVEEHARSGMELSSSTCQLAPASAYYSLTWCAGCIAHEAHHARLAESPSHTYGLAEEELDCIAFQRAVSERLGAPDWELDYLATLDGSHFDLDGDGRYTWDDYERRHW
jgi:hypothetical protein